MVYSLDALLLMGDCGVMTDEDFMQLAIAKARQAAGLGEVPVGAVIVSPKGQILAQSGNAPIRENDPTAHAEIRAIRAAGELLGNYRLKDCTLYVTLEPCTMCAGAISHARLSRLVFGAYDPKGGAVQNGVSFFDSPSCHHRPEVLGGINESECSILLKDFFRAKRNRA